LAYPSSYKTRFTALQTTAADPYFNQTLNVSDSLTTTNIFVPFLEANTPQGMDLLVLCTLQTGSTVSLVSCVKLDLALVADFITK
jgi:hypothetical protein